MAIETLVLSPDDWRMWRELRLTALAEAPAAFRSTSAAWSGTGDTEQRWRTRLHDVALNLVLVEDEVPVGMVSARAPDTKRPVELTSMWVAPTARGHGIGNEAIRQVLAWAHREHPTSHVELSVKQDNYPARQLYRRHGFVDAGPSPDDPDERQMYR